MDIIFYGVLKITGVVSELSQGDPEIRSVIAQSQHAYRRSWTVSHDLVFQFLADFAEDGGLDTLLLPLD